MSGATYPTKCVNPSFSSFRTFWAKSENSKNLLKSTDVAHLLASTQIRFCRPEFMVLEFAMFRVRCLFPPKWFWKASTFKIESNQSPPAKPYAAPLRILYGPCPAPIRPWLASPISQLCNPAGCIRCFVWFMFQNVFLLEWLQVI